MSEKWWLVTGASRGIGRAIAQALGDSSRPLILTATKRKNLNSICTELKSRRCRAESLALDLCDAHFGKTLREALHGRELAGLVNNAGVLERGKLVDMNDSQIDRVFGVNVVALAKVTQIALGHMHPGARIVNLGSISGTIGSAEASIYNASKWAVTGLTTSWAEELREREIFVGEVRPGSVDTDMLKQTPFSPAVKAEEVARLVRFLALEAPMSMSGAALDIFG